MVPLERKNTLQLPSQGSLEFLSPEDMPGLPANGGPRVSMGNIHATNRRVSAVSTSSRRSTDSNEYRRNSSMSGPDEAIPVDPSDLALDEKEESKINSSDIYICTMIPTLPMPAAMVCLLMNIVLPGSGTALSGCLCLCIKEAEVKGVESGNVLCTNLLVGISQLTTVTFLLVGWFWSLAWGIYLVQNATLKVEKEKREEARVREQQLKQKALSMLMGGAMAAAAAAAKNAPPPKASSPVPE